MRHAWKRLAERADNSSFTADQVAEAVCPALADDWRAEVPASLVEAVASVLGEGTQAGLFAGDTDELGRLRVACDSPLAAAFVDAAGDVLVDGLRGPQAIEQAVEAALQDRALREIRSVEEHYLRKSPRARAVNVRARLESSVARASFDELARAISKGEAFVRRFKPVRRDGLDEGVPL
jgi:hypothetical protein